ncbi:hypothetical protein BDY24DRAFT_131842 [Mrakia frigida]|uniref:uncharacterized protein n=1 Tax=Mrakia frigida TaxID=29902 RepID=UPI003FCC1941
MERDHPLALELASLRGAVSKYQHASHQSGIQLQGSRLEYTLLAEKVKGLETENFRLQTEVEVLRTNPPIVSPTPDSLALKQLTLAHRKLSALLTSTEEALSSKTTDLVNCQAELARTIMDRNLCRKAEDDTRMMWNEMDDKIDEEKDLRWKVQVDRDLCNSIIEQYQKLYPAFVPVVPPPKPWHDPPPPTPPNNLEAIPTRSIPDLFAGRTGLEKLLSDFAAETKVLKGELREAKMLAAEAAKKLVLEEKGAEAERVLRADAINELDRKTRDDRAAAGVVERYMAFSQTSSLALHGSLQNLRTRHTATLATLNAQIIELQRMHGEEQARGQALLRSLGTLGEEVGRESAGRRREIGLRLAALGREERILETVRRWEEKARTALRRSPMLKNGEPSSSSSKSPYPEPDPATTTVVQLIHDASNLVSTISSEEDLSSSAAKILLSEDLAAGLIEELRCETERRVALEREKRELLGDASSSAAATAAAAASKPTLVPEESAVLVDVPTEEEKEKDLPVPPPNGTTTTQQERLLLTSPFTSPTTALPPLPTPVPSDTPLLHSLKTIASLHLPLQNSFHTLHQSLLSLQSTLSEPSPDPPIPHQPILLSAVERLMDISEDARVELEIHVDDEVRVARGFVAILEVGGTGKVEGEAEAFVEGRRGRNKVGEVFRRRLEDLEYDAAAVSFPCSPSPSLVRFDSLSLKRALPFLLLSLFPLPSLERTAP